jgi:5-methylcytosine-specific restriction endonuclease McrA
MEHRTLVLTSWYMPIQIITWRDAIVDLYQNKVESIIDYDDVVRSPSIEMKIPAVVRIYRRTKAVKPKVRFSKVNIATRDGGRCQYCLEKFPVSKLTFDHIFPKSRGGETTWENVVCACRACNMGKGNKTPEEAGMRLHTVPRRPETLPAGPLKVQGTDIPEQWAGFVTAVV